MDNFREIQQKLEAFIRKYYINELLRGLILFTGFGLLYFLFILFLEHILWLDPTARTFLFWLFISVEVALFVQLILLPGVKLFKLQKGITPLQASKIIGDHFTEINDKLVNTLQLFNRKEKSELLLASINQKAITLRPIPFTLAINFKHNIKYIKYAIVPLLIIFFSLISGKINWFSDSYERVVNYSVAYDQPPPFYFFIKPKPIHCRGSRF